MSKVQVSIIFCGRNDNINGNFTKRALWAQSHNITLLTEHDISFEQIYIEWNPIPKIPYFAEELKTVNPNLNVLVVPPEIHRHYCDNKNINVMQFFAKNVGALRANGSLLIITNSDTYLSLDVIKRLQNVEQKSLYLYNRLDLNSNLLNNDSISPQELIDPQNIVSEHPITPPENFGAAGDLMLLERSFFHELSGYTEKIRFSSVHVDTLFCRNVQLSGGKIVDDGVIYHMDHADSFINSNNDMSKNHNGFLYEWSRMKLPYNNSTWGIEEATDVTDYKDNNILSVATEELRQEQPDPPHIPAVFCSNKIFSHHFLEALILLVESQLPVMLYGFGTEMRSAYNKGWLEKIKLVGVIDDQLKALSAIEEIPVYTFDQAKLQKFDVVLIGSAWWAHKLIPKAVEEWGTGRVLPMQKGSTLCNYYTGKEMRYIKGHLQQFWKLLHKLHPKKSLFGAGKHTKWFLSFLKQQNLPMPNLILDDNPVTDELMGIKIVSTAIANKKEIGAVILSTDQLTDQMKERASSLWGNHVEIYELYENMSITPFNKEILTG